MSFAIYLAAALAAQSAPAATAPPPLDLVPAFIGACMNPGPEAEKIRDAVIKAGGQSAPEQPGKSSADPSRLSGYNFKTAVPYSVIFNNTGTCAVVSRGADVTLTKTSLAQFVAGATAVFNINPSKPPAAKLGETIVSSYMLSSKKGGPGIWISLSKVSRDGASATFLSRHLVAAKH